jgi:hypothetical protein
MSELRKTSEPTARGPAEAPPVYLDARRELAVRYLFGKGLEIGPLHQPVAMPPGVTVSYVDRLKVADPRRPPSLRRRVRNRGCCPTADRVRRGPA